MDFRHKVGPQLKGLRQFKQNGNTSGNKWTIYEFQTVSDYLYKLKQKSWILKHLKT